MTVIYVDGIPYQAKRIGKGQFSTVYQVGDRAVYYTKDDCAKEVIALFGSSYGSKHIPEIIRHDDIAKGRSGYYWKVFSSPIYRNVTKRDTSAYMVRKLLLSWWNQFHIIVGYNTRRRYESYEYMLAFVEFLKDSPIPRSIISALHDIVELARNCGGTINFDFQERNFGINQYGTLIFRDVFWVKN